MLNDLRAKFDYVIVDSTPLLAVTDAAILSAAADGVLIMARYGQTRREQLTHAVSSLQNVGAPLLGAVLAMVPTRGGAAYNDNYADYVTEPSRRPSDDASSAIEPKYPVEATSPNIVPGPQTTKAHVTKVAEASRSRAKREE